MQFSKGLSGRVVVSGVLGSLLMGCATTPLPVKRTFIGAADGGREEVEVPVGLNPLGKLETCGESEAVSEKNTQNPRVLVSRPEFLTGDASVMLLALRDGLKNDAGETVPIDMWISKTALNNPKQAAQEGIRCGAVIVLWEAGSSKTLELTLPRPAKVPLRSLVQKRLCEFGDHAEQLQILFLTIIGLAAVEQNDFDKAHVYLTQARKMDARCFHLPSKIF